MLEQTFVPLRAGRLQCEGLVAPVKKTPNRIIYLTEKPGGNAFPKYGKAPDTSKTDPLNTSVGYDINSVIAELEERRAKLLALVSAAETRAREAEEEYEQFKSRQKQETNQRLVTEQKSHPVLELSQWKEEGELGGAEERLRQQEKCLNNFILYAMLIMLLVGTFLLLMAAFR